MNISESYDNIVNNRNRYRTVMYTCNASDLDGIFYLLNATIKPSYTTFYFITKQSTYISRNKHMATLYQLV